MFVTNCISTTKIQKISEITNFFRHYFLSRTEVVDKENRNDFYKSIEGRYKTHTSQKIFSRINIVKEAFLHGTK